MARRYIMPAWVRDAVLKRAAGTCDGCQEQWLLQAYALSDPDGERGTEGPTALNCIVAVCPACLSKLRRGAFCPVVYPIYADN